MFQCCSLRTSHPRLLPQTPKVCSVHLCLFNPRVESCRIPPLEHRLAPQVAGGAALGWSGSRRGWSSPGKGRYAAGAPDRRAQLGSPASCPVLPAWVSAMSNTFAHILPGIGADVSEQTFRTRTGVWSSRREVSACNPMWAREMKHKRKGKKK